jgi:hypothetical protein
MNIDGQNLKTLSQKEKEKKWNDIRLRWTEQAELNFQSDNKEVSQLMVLELLGGECPRCHDQWEKIQFDNLFGAGEYYKPVCHCYQSCPRCGIQLYLNDASGQLKENNYFCTNCHFPLTEISEKMVLDKLEEFDRRYRKIYYNRIKGVRK